MKYIAKKYKRTIEFYIYFKFKKELSLIKTRLTRTFA